MDCVREGQGRGKVEWKASGKDGNTLALSLPQLVLDSHHARPHAPSPTLVSPLTPSLESAA
jgi:hypothetical protein